MACRASEVLMEWCVQERTTEVHSGVTTTRIVKVTRNFMDDGALGLYRGSMPFDPADRNSSFLITADTHFSTSHYLNFLL
ncbi:hypothetical protein HJFPF1_06023 [Paramyrothecium foliicola]|nr:hypothetical protein HJFPF1_06023 [Paramyrothecium foliicola]